MNRREVEMSLARLIMQLQLLTGVVCAATHGKQADCCIEYCNLGHEIA